MCLHIFQIDNVVEKLTNFCFSDIIMKKSLLFQHNFLRKIFFKFLAN